MCSFQFLYLRIKDSPANIVQDNIQRSQVLYDRCLLEVCQSFLDKFCPMCLSITKQTETKENDEKRTGTEKRTKLNLSKDTTYAKRFISAYLYTV